MAVTYQSYHAAIGPFPDTAHVLRLLARTIDRVERDRELQEDLIDLLRPMYEAANAARAGGSRTAPELNVRDWEALKEGLRRLYVRRLV